MKIVEHTTRGQRIAFLNAWYAIMPRTTRAIRTYNMLVKILL